MKTSALRLTLLLTVIAVAGTTVGTSKASLDPDLQQLAGYREWQRLTDKPIAVNTSSIAG